MIVNPNTIKVYNTNTNHIEISFSVLLEDGDIDQTLVDGLLALQKALEKIIWKELGI